MPLFPICETRVVGTSRLFVSTTQKGTMDMPVYWVTETAEGWNMPGVQILEAPYP